MTSARTNLTVVSALDALTGLSMPQRGEERSTVILVGLGAYRGISSAATETRP
jgi:hypothetical protein